MQDLDSIMKDLERYLGGIKKQAQTNTEKDVLEGDRKELEPGTGEDAMPASEVTDEEQGIPEAQENGSKEEDDQTDTEAYDTGKEEDVQPEKAAKLANEILSLLKKSSSSPQKQQKGTKKPEAGEAKKQMKQAFLVGLKNYGESFLSKVASVVDPQYQAIKEYWSGVAVADRAINSQNTQKMAYDRGSLLAQAIIQKYAADLTAVNPIIEQLVSKGLLDSPQKQNLVQELGAATELTPEVISQAVASLQNSALIEKALLEAIQGNNPQMPETAPVTLETETAQPEGTAENIILQAALNALRS